MAHGISKLPTNAYTELVISSHHEEAGLVFSLSTLPYLVSVQLYVLHWLGITEEHHLLNDVHLVVDIDGFMKSPIIWKTQYNVTLDQTLCGC